MKNMLLLMAVVMMSPLAQAFEPDWSQGAVVPSTGRHNIYQMPAEDFVQYRTQGRLHAQFYPVTVTGVLPPYAPVKRLIEEENAGAFRRWIQKIVNSFSGYRKFEDILKSLGLHSYPKATDEGVYSVPFPDGVRPEHALGFGLIERNGAQGFTFSCAACHSSNLFGKTVLGMTNRFPRANEFFLQAKKVLPLIQPHVFQHYTHATAAERDLLIEAQDHMASIDLKPPIALGLDTSLAQVALSLNRRSKDSYASYSWFFSRFPRYDDYLGEKPADSKPAVWWNVKYKNRWLSDGSVLSGNPIFTNIIWNEIGRGVDLHVLEDWLAQNSEIIKELTTAVFSSEAPKITDFYPAEKIELERAQAGEKIFNNTCARCHGHYDKAWSLPFANELTHKEKLETVQVRYKEKTSVVNVGTDPHRYKGMKSLEQLNHLAISKKNDIVIQAQEGYVPPPLVGIWARWPYFHNNSVPTLCALLTPANKRPIAYYSGEPLNTETDFDFECNGYPAGEKMPKSWKKKRHFYDTRVKGLSNSGHDEGIFVRNGKEILSEEDKRNLIQFLQTL